MEIKRVVQIAILMAGTYQVRAETVEAYQATKAKPDSFEATLDRLYIRAFGQGIQFANVELLQDSSIAGHPIMLFCEPENLALNEDNYMSIIDAEIKRRLDGAAGNLNEIRNVMQTDIQVLLLRGLKRTFPCSPALILDNMKLLLQHLGVLGLEPKSKQ